MTNRQMIEAEIVKQGFQVGCINGDFEGMTKKQMDKVLDELGNEYTDVIVFKNRRKHIVEIATVDGEKDLQLFTKDEYIGRYGEECWFELNEK